MKITIKEDGSLIIDGQNNTVIYDGSGQAGATMIVDPESKTAYWKLAGLEIVGGDPKACHEYHNMICCGLPLPKEYCVVRDDSCDCDCHK